MELPAITYGTFLLLFLIGAFLVVILNSPNNKLRIAAWLESSARAQEEMRAAKQGIENEARIYQRRREIALLAEKGDKPRVIRARE